MDCVMKASFVVVAAFSRDLMIVDPLSTLVEPCSESISLAVIVIVEVQSKGGVAHSYLYNYSQ